MKENQSVLKFPKRLPWRLYVGPKVSLPPLAAFSNSTLDAPHLVLFIISTKLRTGVLINLVVKLPPTAKLCDECYTSSRTRSEI